MLPAVLLPTQYGLSPPPCDQRARATFTARIRARARAHARVERSGRSFGSFRSAADRLLRLDSIQTDLIGPAGGNKTKSAFALILFTLRGARDLCTRHRRSRRNTTLAVSLYEKVVFDRCNGGTGDQHCPLLAALHQPLLTGLNNPIKHRLDQQPGGALEDTQTQNEQYKIINNKMVYCNSHFLFDKCSF